MSDTRMNHLPANSLLDPVLEELGKGGGFLTTEHLKQQLRDRFRLSGEDGAMLEDNVAADHVFNQRVLQLIAEHRHSAGPQSAGLAHYDADRAGWHITREGHDYVNGVT